MASKLSSYENQAKLSVALGVVGLLAVIANLVLLFRNFDATSFFVSYRRESLYLPLLLLGLLVGLAASGIGFLVGLNSAGQKRNAASALSWQGFFLNAAVITLLLCCVVFFFFTRNPVTLGSGQ